MDPDVYRRESRESWNRSAAGWLAAAAHLSRTTMPVSEWLVDALAPQPGHRVLELAAGTGEVGLLIAELVAPHGEVIISDFSPAMLTAAQERAAERGLTTVRFKQIDAESIDLDAASVDGVVCRWGFMLMADPEAALRETRRVLRPGRSVALSAWDTAESNPWRTALDDAVLARGLTEPPTGGPGMFTWAERGTIVEHLEAAGFVDPEIEALDFSIPYASVDDWLDQTRTISARLDAAISPLSDAEMGELRAELEAAVEPYTAADGTLSLPARSWVAVAAA